MSNNNDEINNAVERFEKIKIFSSKFKHNDEDNYPEKMELPYFRYNQELNNWEEYQFDENNENQRRLYDGQDLKIIQYNIWFGKLKLKERMLSIGSIIEEMDPDIVCFEEVKIANLEVLLSIKFFQENYYITDISGNTLGSYGVIHLTKYPYKSLHLNVLVTKLGRNVLIGEIPVYNKDDNSEMGLMSVSNSHLESFPQDVDYRRLQMIRIFSLTSDFPYSIFCADFNFSEEGEDGLYPPQYIDSWDYLHKNEPGYTIDTTTNPLIKNKPNCQKRIDRILFKSPNDNWLPKEVKILGTQPISEELEDVFPSDHFGVYALYSTNQN
eukprot:TRINITY_DN1254_c0_g1_i1.p1 TRINITY_DN1254_c0_g1~~TRINITY_DN1254_c0_g1_i1.p1  ORF type:complete len:325 (+),score=79.61 TRINITY_DN1254_c0_g1_i1:92-1066(+)